MCNFAHDDNSLSTSQNLPPVRTDYAEYKSFHLDHHEDPIQLQLNGAGTKYDILLLSSKHSDCLFIILCNCNLDN